MVRSDDGRRHDHLLWEPHVVPLMRGNIWHVRRRNQDLVIDTGMGVASLIEAASDLFDAAITAVATRGHADHIGGHHEFADVGGHPLEADELDAPKLQSLGPTEAWREWALEGLRSMGHEMHEPSLVTALPPGMPFEAFGRRRAPVTRLVDAGGVIGLGDWCFEVLHLPGHSPGSIGSWEAMTGTLFSGDAIDDGPLLDELDGSKADDDCATMERPLTLPVSVVHGGHDPSFGRERLREIATDDLQRRRG